MDIYLHVGRLRYPIRARKAHYQHLSSPCRGRIYCNAADCLPLHRRFSCASASILSARCVQGNRRCPIHHGGHHLFHVARARRAFVHPRTATVHIFGLAFPDVGMGIMGVWVAMGADWVVRAVLFLFLFVRGTWLHPKKA